MQSIDTINFQEIDTHEECVAIVRADSATIVVTLSRCSDGDLEVAMPPAEATKLRDALSRALVVVATNAG